MSVQKLFFILPILIFCFVIITLVSQPAHAYFVVSNGDVLAGATQSGGVGGGVQTSTTGALPQAGNLTTTILMAVLGLGLVGLGGIKLIFNTNR